MKAINKDKIVLKVGNDILVIDKIKPPTFTIKGETLTEYDVRRLMVAVCRGDVPYKLLNFIGIYDEYGLKLEFRSDGKLTNSPRGLALASEFTMELLGTNRKK